MEMQDVSVLKNPASSGAKKCARCPATNRVLNSQGLCPSCNTRYCSWKRNGNPEGSIEAFIAALPSVRLIPRRSEISHLLVAKGNSYVIKGETACRRCPSSLGRKAATGTYPLCEPCLKTFYKRRMKHWAEKLEINRLSLDDFLRLYPSNYTQKPEREDEISGKELLVVTGDVTRGEISPTQRAADQVSTRKSNGTNGHNGHSVLPELTIGPIASRPLEPLPRPVLPVATCKRCPKPSVSTLTGLCLECDHLYNTWKNIFPLEEQPSLTVERFVTTDFREGLFTKPLPSVKEDQRVRIVIEREAKSLPSNWAASSTAMARVFEMVRRVAPTDETVLITGETGTGKELVAQTIHLLSGKASKDMVIVDCTGLRKELALSELFGHEAGSFTGATRERKGLFSAAHNSTIFLDEISELDLEVQGALLRVIQTGQYRPVGSNRYVPVNARVICATNKNLARLVRRGKFREDLFGRLDVIRLDVLPLRERKEELGGLVRYFLEKISKNVVEVTELAWRAFQAYDWPRNVRELENALRSALILGDGKTIKWENLRPELVQALRQAERRSG